MSSILEALRQLETGGAEPGPDELPPGLERDRSRWPWYALAACVVGLLVFWVLWPGPRDLVAPAPGPGASIADADALPPAAPAPRPRAAQTEPPRARIASPATAPVAEPPEERVATRSPDRTADRMPDRAPEPVEAPRFEAPPRYEDPAPDASASAGVGRTIPRPPGEPIVRIRSLSYSSSPTRRVVSLSVNNSNAISLREGERLGGVEVTLIMPDSIYVKHAGNIFAVSR